MAMSNTIYIHELHAIHGEWISALNLAQDELMSYHNRLQELNSANTSKDILAQVEGFQNRFIRQKEVIDILKHDIQADEKRIAENARDKNVAVEHRKVEKDFDLHEKMEMFEKLFKEMKSEYLQLLEKYL